MAITGYLTEFSLPEIFQFLEAGSKTGVLQIQALPAQPGQVRHHYIWLKQGRIVAAANQLNHQGLIALISQRGWLGDRAASRLAQSCSADTPMGLCLKSQGILQSEQLKLLFYTQVMRQVCALFELQDGWFQFDPKVPLPIAEMTGLNAAPTEVTLAGLRALRDWTALNEKLPSPSSALVSIIEGKPNLNINQLEWQVWEFTNGTTPLTVIAEQLRLSIEKIQQIAFRLIIVGLAEEVPIIAAPPPAAESGKSDPLNTESADGSGVSQSFLQHLVGFLRNKV